MVIVTIGKAEVNFIGVILQQILEFGEGRIGFGRTVSAIPLVQVFAAFGAKSLAIGFAKRADGNLQQGIFAEQKSEVEVGIFGEDESRVGFGSFVEGVQLGEGPIQFAFEIGETACAGERGLGGEIRLHDQSLRRFADVDQSLEGAQFKIFAEGDRVELEREVVVVADFLMDDESDIETEEFFRAGHGIAIQ